MNYMLCGYDCVRISHRNARLQYVNEAFAGKMLSRAIVFGVSCGPRQCVAISSLNEENIYKMKITQTHSK